MNDEAADSPPPAQPLEAEPLEAEPLEAEPESAVPTGGEAGTEAESASLRRGWRRLRRPVGRGVLVLVAVSLLLVLPWRWIPVPTSSFMVRHRLQEERWPQYRWVPWEEISPHLAIAVIAAEDQKFPQHHGFDLGAIQEALGEDGPRRRGASTLSQQVAKNLYLWPGRSYLRKGAEAYLTVLLELCWPKQRILEVYLNVAEFGPGVYGAEAASRRFFSRSARDLDPRQAALLAAVLPSPRRRSAAQPSAGVQRRADRIQRQVQNLDGVAYLESL